VGARNAAGDVSPVSSAVAVTASNGKPDKK
jgi:hypothetical protein